MDKDKQSLLMSLKNQEFSDEIIKALAKVRREDFVPDHLAQYAYEDLALPLDDGSTLSQPSTIAFVLQLLELKQNQSILEIGSGSGYLLALISEIIKSGKIYGLEINPRLAIKSKNTLKNDSNIEIFNRSGLNGFSEQAPFDRIIVSAAFEEKSIPYNKILPQLKDGGIIVVPVKNSVLKVSKEPGNLSEKEYPGFSFVPFKVE